MTGSTSPPPPSTSSARHCLSLRTTRARCFSAARLTLRKKSRQFSVVCARSICHLVHGVVRTSVEFFLLREGAAVVLIVVVLARLLTAIGESRAVVIALVVSTAKVCGRTDHRPALLLPASLQLFRL